VLTFHNRIDEPGWQEWWDKFAKLPRDEFAKEASTLLGDPDNGNDRLIKQLRGVCRTLAQCVPDLAIDDLHCSADAAWREEARLQVHTDDGGLRSHQTAKIDRRRGLNDATPPHIGKVATLRKSPIYAETSVRRPVGHFSAAC